MSLSSLTDLNYKPGHKKHTFYKFWLASNGHIDKNGTALLDAYRPEKIHSQYIIRMAGKSYTVINYPSEVYKIPDTHEYIDGNQSLRLIIDIDARQKPDPNNLKLPSLDISLNKFVLANSSNAKKCSWHIIYSHTRFIDYRDLKGFVEKVIELVGEPYTKFIDIGLYKSHFNFQLLGSAKKGCIKQPAIFSIKNGFKNLEDYLKPAKEESQSIDNKNVLVKRKCPICGVKHDKNQLYGLIRKNGDFILKCYRQKQYKPEHKGLSFDKVSNKVELKEKPKWRLIKRLPKTLLTLYQFPKLPGKSINVKEIEDALDAFQDFLNKVPSTTLICSTKTLSNESEAKFKELEKFNFKVGQYQNIVANLKTHKGSEAIRRGLRMLQEVYFDQMDGKQHQDDFANINTTWSALDCVIYTSTVKAGISFEISDYFDAVIKITNIATPVQVKAKKFDIFKEPCRELIRAELSVLRPGDLLTIIKGQRAWDKIADCYALNLSPAVETYIEVEYQRCLSAKYFPEILCSLIASTGNIEKKIKSADAELIANALDIGDIGSKDDIRNWGMNNDNWVKLCNLDFVKRFNNSETLQHFRRLVYFRRQGANAINSIENLKIKEEMQ
ncbi:hypothetical protein C2G38_2167771 [Gigaspora rosea]|uniref:Replication origin-binding protein domain-containing protein n=1 Tax=Gigaspora rosea TaxID=44941 RepID=A0A397VXK2_9GLOM|nr:hypothetical protein C2G38_2167771 [Gigaspora rosea]